jgi:peptidoglycan/LPS O-acetylase OafA/YrhL
MPPVDSVLSQAQPEDAAKRTTRKAGTVASLELLRGLASLDVFLWHLLNSPSGFPQIPGLYRIADWSRESVIVFFVLSGYVIALSQQRRHRAAQPFFKARIKRIVPLYLIALGAAILVGYIIAQPCTPWQIVGHLLFLQSYEGSLVAPLPSNGPLWSLGTEFEFYMLLTLILAVRRPSLIFVWWACSLVGLAIRYTGHVGTGLEGLLLEFLGLSPCWLLGFFFAGLGARYSLTLFQALTLFLMIPMVSDSDYGTVLVTIGAVDNLKCLFLALLIAPLIHTLAVRQIHPEAKPMKQGWLIVLAAFVVVSIWATIHPAVKFGSLPLIVTVMIPVVFCAGAHLLLPAKTSWPVNTGFFRRTSLFLGGASYALYVIHTPLMLVAIADVANLHLRFAVTLFAVGFAVVFLEYVVQPRAAKVIDYLWQGTK